MADARERLGKKNRFTTYVREDLVHEVGETACIYGQPITRVIEDALLIYLGLAMGERGIEEMIDDVGFSVTASGLAASLANKLDKSR
jgi:hypothetical protein